jgi:hypothetical protein
MVIRTQNYQNLFSFIVLWEHNLRSNHLKKEEIHGQA